MQLSHLLSRMATVARFQAINRALGESHIRPGDTEGSKKKDERKEKKRKKTKKGKK